MPLQYDPQPDAFYTEGESLTEQEWKDSCDINKMMKNIHRGIDVRGNPAQPVYGYDDLTLDAVQHRILKEKTEKNLEQLARENEFSEEELKLIPKSIQDKFKMKVKKAANQNEQIKTNEINAAPNQTSPQNQQTSPQGTKTASSST